MAVGYWLLAVGYWQLARGKVAASYWLLAASYWLRAKAKSLPASSYWLPAKQPPVIRNELASAIGTLGKELSAASSDENCSDFHLLVEGTSRDIVPIIRDEIYRIACEALRNAFKHAHARRIEVELYYDPRKFRLRVCDNGNGIDPKLLAEGGRSQHYGLPGMQERARLVKGKLTVLSSPESGTEIALIIPAAIA